MKYSYKNVPLNTPVYATAYWIDNETLIAYLRCKPILGEVIDLERYKKEVGDNPPRFLRGTTQKYYIDGKWEERYEKKKPKNIFMPYRVGTKTFRKNGVQCNSRDYADTYEETVENYNDDVQDRIDRLLELAEEVKNDFIK